MAIALLTAGLVIAASIAVVEYVQLRAARDRIEELEAGGGDGGGDGGGLFEGVDELLEDLLGDLGGELGRGLDLLGCIGGPGLGLGGGAGGEDVPAIADEVERIRELRFRQEPEPTFLSDQETSERVRELFLEEYTPRIADIEQRILTALGAIPAGTDLRRLRAGALGEQVAGFYEPETGELVIRQSGPEISAIDRITLAHELDHALTDQALGIPLPDDPELGSEDAQLGALALVEGDATLVMQRFSAGLGLEAQLELADPEAIARAEAGLADFPPYLEQELRFPYEQGLAFVCDLFADGGWAAVNEAYDDPPTSSAQVLFPDRYHDREDPVDPRPAKGPSGGWRSGPVLEVGAANLLWLFQAPGGDASAGLPDPLAAAREWAGGSIALWTRGPDTAVAMTLVDRPGGRPLCDPVAEWYARVFPDDREERGAAAALVSDGSEQDAVVTCRGDQVRVGIGPVRGVADDLVR